MMNRRFVAVALATLFSWGCAPPPNIIDEAISAGAPRNEVVDDLTVVTPRTPESESPVQRAPEAAPITIRIAYAAGDQSATVNIRFFIQQPAPDPRIRQVTPPIGSFRPVRTTTFRMQPGGRSVDIGPELASRVEVRGSFPNGVPFRARDYVFATNFESPDGSTRTYEIEDPQGVADDVVGPAEIEDEGDVEDAPDSVEDVVVEDDSEEEIEDEDVVPPIDTGGNTGPDTGDDTGDDGAIVDCNGNGVADATDIAACDGEPGCGDCDQDGQPDECAFNNTDCDGNGLSDECEIAEGLLEDCNLNGVPDDCDLASGSSRDFDEDGIPDECGLLVITPIESVATFGQTILFTATQDVTWEASAAPGAEPGRNPGTIAADGTYSPPPFVDLMAAPAVRIRANSVGTPGLFAIAQVTLFGSTTASPRIESLLSGPGSPDDNPMNVNTSSTVATLLAPGQGDQNGLTLNVTFAHPPADALLTGRGDSGDLNLGVTTADPAVAVLLPAADDSGGLALNMFVAAPPVTELLTGAGDGGGEPLNVTVTFPPTMILQPGQGLGGLPLNVFVTQPPVIILQTGSGFAILPLNVFIADPPVAIDLQ